MFEQIVRGALWFAVVTYAIGTLKTMTIAAGADGEGMTRHTMVVDEGRKPLIYPVIDGTDTPMPFSEPSLTSSRVVGFSKIYYAVYPGTTIRDNRYQPFWR